MTGGTSPGGIVPPGGLTPTERGPLSPLALGIIIGLGILLLICLIILGIVLVICFVTHIDNRKFLTPGIHCTYIVTAFGQYHHNIKRMLIVFTVELLIEDTPREDRPLNLKDTK